MPTMRAAWSSASVFDLRSTNPAGLVPPEERDHKKTYRREAARILGIFSGKEQGSMDQAHLSGKRLQTGADFSSCIHEVYIGATP